MPVFDVKHEWKGRNLKESYSVIAPPGADEKIRARLETNPYLTKISVKLNKKKTEEYEQAQRAQNELSQNWREARAKIRGEKTPTQKREEKKVEANVPAGTATLADFFESNLHMINTSTRQFRKAVIDYGTNELGHSVSKVCGRYNALVAEYIDAGRLTKPARGVLEIVKENK